ncbi:MAG: response regulator [bacterium]
MAIPKDINFLIVDDFFSVRKIITSNLKRMGFTGKLLEADNITDAEQILREQSAGDAPIHFICSDWDMPGGSGLDFLKIVRADEQFKNLPFLMVTAVGEKDNVLQAIQAGASNYLMKPWTINDFTKRLDAAWNKHNK